MSLHKFDGTPFKLKYRLFLYFLSYLAILYSAFSLFKDNTAAKAFIVLFVTFLFLYFKKKIDKRFTVTLLFFIFIFFVQFFRWGGSLYTFLTFSAFVILVPYFLVKIIGFDFPKYVTELIFIYAIISLAFWTLTNISPQFYNWTSGLATLLGTDPVNTGYEFSGKPEQFILYTYEAGVIGPFIRNPGPFHEPGAFAVFLILGLIFNSMISNKFLSWKNFTMTLALLTTFSSAGYLSFLVLVSFSVVVSSISRANKIFLFLIMLGISVYFFIKLPFLSEKLESQYNEQADVSLNTTTSGRILGARKALYVFAKYPLTGRGILSSMLPEYDSPEAAGYGFMSFGSRIGIPAFFLFLLYFHKSIRQYCLYYSFNKRYSIFAFLALMIVLFGEPFIGTMVFMMLFFASIVNPNFGSLERLYNNKSMKYVS